VRHEGRLLRRCEVESRVGLRRSEIYRRIGIDAFPRPVRLGARCVRWREQDIEAWIAAKVAASGLPESVTSSR
jgi:prophage regulatory protein